MNQKGNKGKALIVWIALLGFVFFVLYLFSPFKYILGNKVEYDANVIPEIENIEDKGFPKNEKEASTNDEYKDQEVNRTVSHIETPEKLKAIYISSWVAGTTSFRDSLIKIIDETELNAVVIDIKDSTGKISFQIENDDIKNIGSAENRIRNIENLIDLLHSKNIYIIGRISVFQDLYLAKLKPEWAIKKISDGKVWQDRKGLSFLDPTNTNVHKYILAIAQESYNLGFDEINLDYIRYPSDGNMKDINYNLKQGQNRSDNIESFFKYISGELKKDQNIPLSGDLFGLTTEVTDDMGIGQLWQKALPYFDYLCPMIYPSHYPSGHAGYSNPASYPYQVIDRALKGAIAKTEQAGYKISKIRPWLQDFDMGAKYTKELVRAQIKATNDNKIESWMLWDPSNKYTKEALIIDKKN